MNSSSRFWMRPARRWQWIAPAWILVACCVGATAAANEAAASANRREALKQAFHFSPVPTDSAVAEAPDGAVVLEKLTVVQSMERRQMTAMIEDRWRRDAADKFDWKKGGSIYSSGKLDVGFWPELESPVLGEAAPVSAIRLKLTLIKLKW